MDDFGNTVITSKSNDKVKYLKQLFTKKGRKTFNRFIVEGEKFIEEISDGFMNECIFVSQSFFEEYSGGILKGKTYYILKDNVFKEVSDTVSPQGIIGVFEQRNYDAEEIINKSKNPFVVMCENIQDPGNMGSLIRSADAFGCDVVLVSGDSVDIYHHKVIRASAGSIFHVPVVVCEVFNMIPYLKQKGITVYGTALDGAVEITKGDFQKPSAVIVGNEGNGLSNQAKDVADCLVKIPMDGLSESLNASVALGIVLYEVSRQRRCK